MTEYRFFLLLFVSIFIAPVLCDDIYHYEYSSFAWDPFFNEDVFPPVSIEITNPCAIRNVAKYEFHTLNESVYELTRSVMDHLKQATRKVYKIKHELVYLTNECGCKNQCNPRVYKKDMKEFIRAIALSYFKTNLNEHEDSWPAQIPDFIVIQQNQSHPVVNCGYRDRVNEALQMIHEKLVHLDQLRIQMENINGDIEMYNQAIYRYDKRKKHRHFCYAGNMTKFKPCVDVSTC